MFHTEPLKIVPNGLNLLAPGDQVPEGDCLDLTGWWPEDAGKLQQGRGYVIKSNGYGHAVDTILDADGRFYFAGGGSLSRFGTGVLGTGWGSDPVGAISYRGWGWFTSASLQKRDNGTTYTNWAIETPAAAPTETNSNAGELLDGDYEYYVTFQNADSFEGNPSPQRAFTLSAGDVNDVTITRPSSTSAEISHWNVYRHGPGLAAPYKVNLDPIPIATTTFHDDGSVGNFVDNESLIARDEVMEADHDAPPAAKVIANKLFNGRIVVANSTAHPNRIWYTPALRPHFFRGSANPQAGDWVDVGDDSGDEILAITVHPSRCIVYRRKSVWQVVSDFEEDGSRIEPLIPDVGTVGFRSVASSSLGDYFAANNGLYRVSDAADKISVKIDPVFSGFTVGGFPTVNTSCRQLVAVGINEGRVWVSIPGDPLTANSYCLIYHPRTDRWYTKSLGISCFTRGQTEFLGGLGEKVASLETGFADDGAGIPVSYQSAYIDAGFPDREKTWGDLVVTHRTGGQNLTITVYTNKQQDLSGADSFTLATINSASQTRQVIPMVYPATYSVVAKRGKPIRSYNVSIKISGTGPAVLAGVLIESPIFLHYYIEARKGKTFDTGPTDHGIPARKQIDQVEIDIDAPGNAALQVQSDLPGGVLTNRVNAAITATSGRQIVTIVLPSAVEGKLFRHQVTSDTDFHVYGFRVRTLPIGVYLDGSVLDSWDTQPMAISA